MRLLLLLLPILLPVENKVPLENLPLTRIGPLEQVETLLKTQDPPAAPKPTVQVAAPPTVNSDPKVNDSLSTPNNLTVNDPSISLTTGGDMDQWNFNGDHSPQPPQPADTFDFNAIPMQNSFTWEMIGLGLEEPLPPQESIDEL